MNRSTPILRCFAYCVAAFFASSPSSSVFAATLAGSVVSPAGTIGWSVCASEGSNCLFEGTRQVRYGANGFYTYKTATDSISCNNTTFGDPIFGVVKACFFASAASVPVATAPPITAPILTPPIAPISPISPTTPTEPAKTIGWSMCASEGGNCSFEGTRQVRYGANGSYTYKTATDSISCNNTTFGDPVLGVVKACFFASAASAPVATAPGTTTPILTPPIVLTSPISTTTPAEPAPAALVRSMWVWDDEDIGTSALQDTMIEFAVGRKVNVISVHAPGLLMTRPAVLAAFINRAAVRQVKVELLFGQPTWMLTANHQQALDYLARANNFVRSLNGAKPIGVHFDVEPHVLAGWDANRVSYGNQLINLYAKLQAAKLPDLHLNVDMALGYRDVIITRDGVTKSLSHWLVDTVDRTTIMSYRDFAFGPDSIIYHASHPVDYAATKGKQVMVSVETICGLDPEKITFCEEGLIEMNAAIDSVYANYKTNTGFGGMSLHDYRNLRHLQ